MLTRVFIFEPNRAWSHGEYLIEKLNQCECQGLHPQIRQPLTNFPNGVLLFYFLNTGMK